MVSFTSGSSIVGDGSGSSSSTGVTAPEFRKVVLPTGAAALNFVDHNNAELHAESGTTSVTMAASAFSIGGAQQTGRCWVFNYTGAAISLTLGTGWSGGVSEDGETTNDLTSAGGTLVSIPHAKKALVVFDDDAWVRAAVLGMEVSQAELDAALTGGSVQALFDTLRADSVHFLAASTDLNALTGTGWYNVQNATNGPAGGGWYYVFNGDHRNGATGTPNVDYSFQIAKRLDASGTNNLLMRVQVANAWTAWLTLATTGDIPAYSATAPVVDGTAAAGTAVTVSRGDHVHPTDTTRAAATALTDGSVNAYFDRLRWDGATAISSTNLNSLTVSGFYDGQTLTNAPNGAAGWFYVLHQRHSNLADVNWHHQTAYALGSGAGSTAGEIYARNNVSGTWSAWVRVDNGAVPALSSTAPAMDGIAAVGTGTTSARADHVHASDTSRASAAAPVKSYSASSTYAVGDQVIQANVLYKCKTAITVAEAFTIAKWDVVGSVVTVNDTLTSTSTTEALSAAQGKVLQDGKQALLVSGTSIKTLNSQSLLGAGNIAVGASAASVTQNGDGSGGTVTQVGNDRVHTFLSSGTFVAPTGVSAVRVLVVGGGGGGGAGRYPGDSGRPGGGGGSGRYRYEAAFSVTPGASIPITVGLGGAGATDADDTDAGTGGAVGGNSTFSTLTALGGGGGGGHHRTNSSPWDVPADQGGSGGGSSNGSSGAAAIGTSGGLGNAGGNGASGTLAAGGGGGGSGGAGGNGNSTSGTAGAGGAGTANDIRSGSNVTYAAGGAGSHSATGGHVGADAAANTGNGGEGSYQGGTSGGNGVTPAGDGGSGIVVVRYTFQSLDTPVYANNAAAIAGGLALGQLYRTGADPDVLCVVH